MKNRILAANTRQRLDEGQSGQREMPTIMSNHFVTMSAKVGLLNVDKEKSGGGEYAIWMILILQKKTAANNECIALGVACSSEMCIMPLSFCLMPGLSG